MNMTYKKTLITARLVPPMHQNNMEIFCQKGLLFQQPQRNVEFMSCNILVLNMLAVYMLDSQGSIPGGDGNFLFSKASRLALGAHPASYSVGTNGALPRLKWLAHTADHLPPSSP
jgi:hypothetical protein